MTWISKPIPGGWVFENKTHEAKIVLDYIYPIARGLEAWVELWVEGADIPLSAGQRNLMTAGAISPFLRDVGPEDPIPWEDGLKQAFYTTIESWRDGAATIDLTTVEPRGLSFLVKPLVEMGGNTRIIAPGESGKSLLALAIALTVTTGSRKFLGLVPELSGPVLYLDWETDAETHATRIQALCKAADVPLPERGLLQYREESLPLYRSIQAVRRAADRCEAVLVVVDSSKMAAGASASSSGEDSTINLFTALREVARPAVILDHKNKEDIRKGRTGGYGNIFNQNLARMEWEFTKLQPIGRNESAFQLSMMKGNNVGDLPPLGFKLRTDGGEQGITSAQFTRVRPESIIEQGETPLPDRIISLFYGNTEPMTVKRIAEITSRSQSAVRGALNDDGRFYNLNEGKGSVAGLWRPHEEYLAAPLDDGVQARLEIEEIPGVHDDDQDDELPDPFPGAKQQSDVFDDEVVY